MADIFDVIADATRRELLDHLREAATSSARGELSVGELVDRMEATQPTVSKHLKVLRDHGLVRVREEGQHRYYSIDVEPLEEVEDFLLPFLALDDLQSGAGSPVFAAWAGADVEQAGSTVGRAAADASFRARSALQGAQERLADVREQVAEAQHSVARRLPWRRDEA
ncbi:ArsR/SmtB family transcription factor [Microcella alkalica]|uniref:ArsR/SmtB family transcription factor n=1 Tax=Microcella alkalica TaxID=355930 RepID=UPI00145DF6D0|nr:metalloregulator ArsR/SmtB family transcription factor [Microcella alkalica]